MTVTALPTPTPDLPSTRPPAGAFEPRQLLASLPQALRKLDPRHQVRSPVMFVVWVGAALTTVLAVRHPSGFAWAITVWLWLTVVFANLAEAVAEGRGRAQAASLRRTRTGIELIPENPDYETIHVPAGGEDQFELEGIAVGLIRNTMLM